MRRSIASLVVVLIAAAAHAQSEAADDLLARAGERIAQRDFRAAEPLARRAVQLAPRSREARATLAWVTLWNGRYREAATLFRSLVAETPDDTAVRLGLAEAEYWSGDLEAARRDYGALQRLDP